VETNIGKQHWENLHTLTKMLEAGENPLGVMIYCWILFWKINKMPQAIFPTCQHSSHYFFLNTHPSLLFKKKSFTFAPSVIFNEPSWDMTLEKTVKRLTVAFCTRGGDQI